MEEGRILKGIAGFFYVECADGRIYACRAKGGFRRAEIRPLPGDLVCFEITHEGDKEGNLVEIKPRKNALIRPAVANVDQALLFFSVRNPDPSLLLLDRYLVFIGRLGLPSILCFNKTDLASEEDLDAIREAYRGCGHRLLFTSVRQGEGIDALREELTGRTTFLAGPSGAGKSSLINRLCPQAGMEIGELSRKLARGKNTTRHSEWFRVAEEADTWLIDTPGFTALELPDLTREELESCYGEFAPYSGMCRFTSCRHMEEPDCAVREAADDGRIPTVRYENYRQLFAEWQALDERKYR